MLYSVDFEELSLRINTYSFSRYLEETGWSRFQTKRKNIKVYQAEKNGRFYQITIPLERNFTDYKHSVTSSIRTLAEYENKAFEQVFLFLMNPTADILKIRINDQSIEPGNMLLDDAINVYENTKRLLGAAVQDVNNLRKYHQGRPEGTAAQFLSNCRFGQTEVGSYIVSVICPFMDAEYEQLSIFDSEEDRAKSLTRMVTTRVMKNLSTIEGLIRKGNFEKLTDVDNTGISGNFYEALLGLYSGKPDAEMEVRAEWSPMVRIAENLSSSFIFSRDYKGPIEYAVRMLKKPVPQSTEIIGRVKALGANPDIERRENGEVTIVFVNESARAKTITLLLKLDDYNTAMEAHRAGRYVKALVNGNETDSRKQICDSLFLL